MSNISEVRQGELHPHRVPKATPLGWVSNRSSKIVSVDLSPALRLKEFERRYSSAILSHARWAAHRYAVVIKRNGLLTTDERVLRQVMAQYRVQPQHIEYAVVRLLLEVKGA